MSALSATRLPFARIN